MSKNTKNQTPVNPVAEKKAVEKKPATPKFDIKAFGTTIINAFKKSPVVELVFDTELEGGPRALNMPDYRYIHIFRKGTTTNCFQAYISSAGVIYVVGKNINNLIPDSKKYVKDAVEKPKGSGNISYYNYRVGHEDAIEVLQLLVDTYNQFNATKAEAKAKAEKEAAEAKEQKAQAKKQAKAEKEQAKAKTEKPKTKKPAKTTKTA